MSSSPKYFLDTSIFIELFKYDYATFEAHIADFSESRRFAAYYSAIELNRGFLQALVKHHQKVVELQDVAAASVVMSNEFGSRITTYGMILQAYMLRFSGGISQNYVLYSAQLESIIFDMTDRINELVKHFTGHFSDHALAALELYDKDGYNDFLKLCDSDARPDLGEFWADYHAQLYKLRDKLLALPRLNTNQLGLLNFVNEIMGGEVSGSYQHMSDFAISLECPKDTTILAHDHSFDWLVPVQDKTGIFVSFG